MLNKDRSELCKYDYERVFKHSTTNTKKAEFFIMSDIIFIEEPSILITIDIKHKFIIDVKLPQQNRNDKRSIQLSFYSQGTNNKAPLLTQKSLYPIIIKCNE